MSSNNFDPAQDQSRFQPGNRPNPPSQNPPGENPTEQMPYQPQPNQQQTWAGHNGPGQGQYVPVQGQNQQHSYAQLQGNAFNQYGHPGQPQGYNPYSPQPRQPWYKRGWAILLFVLVAGAAIFGIVMLASGSDDPEDVATSAEVVETPQPTRGGDDPIDDPSSRGDEPTEITDEYEEAMKDAESYLELFAFSKSELYDQLTSEYGEGLSHEAAQYAVDNVDVDWNEQALKSAEQILEITPYSEESLRERLTAEYGSNFTEEEAEYALDNLDVDWNEQALRAAEAHLEFTPTASDQEIYDYLTGGYGARFTHEQAQYAIDNLP